MADGSIIGTGKGNRDWNFSAPHGAGRLMSRTEAKSKISLCDYQKVMTDSHVYSTSVSMHTIDEAPQVYKNSDSIVTRIADTVNITAIIKPVYNFKSPD